MATTDELMERAQDNAFEELLEQMEESEIRQHLLEKRLREQKRRKRKKKEDTFGALFKLGALIACVIVVCTFWTHGNSYSDFNPSFDTYHDTKTTAATLVQSYTGITQQESAGGSGGRTQVDLSEVYVDAAGVVPSSKGSVVSTATGTPIALNGPTRDLTENAYVVNIEQLMAWMFGDILWAEEQLGYTQEKTAEELAREKLSSFYIFSVENSRDTSSLAGAGSPALLRRDWIDNAGWMSPHPTWGDYAYAAFNDIYQMYFDIMFVKESEVDSYYAGENADVYYVSWRVNDLKAHTGPWGIGQTFIHFGAGKNYGLCSGNAGGYDGDTKYTCTIPITDNTGNDYLSLLKAHMSQGKMAYKVPTVAMQKADINAAYAGVQEIFEYRNNQHWTAFSDWYKSMTSTEKLVCVGVLVYADKDLSVDK